LQNDNATHPQIPLSLSVLSWSLGEMPSRLQTAVNNFHQWSNQFVTQRAAAARRELDNFL
jgi:hypothetical protein